MILSETRPAQTLRESAYLKYLIEQVADHAERSQDHRSIPLGSTEIVDDGKWRYNGSTSRLTRHAFTQLCQRLDLPQGGTAPAGYLARCPNELAASHVNHWLQSKENRDRKVLVRTKVLNGTSQATVRAVLSDRYALADHLPLLRVVEALAPEYDLNVDCWSLDEERLTLRLLHKDDHPATLDDPLRVGVHIQNSEIGLSRISVTALITRLVCSNGLVLPMATIGGVSRRHIGKAGEDLHQTVATALPKVMEHAYRGCETFTRLREVRAPEPVEDFLQQAGRDAELPDSALKALPEVIEGESVYDVINAVTRVAQRLPVADRVRAETAMSHFLTEETLARYAN